MMQDVLDGHDYYYAHDHLFSQAALMIYEDSEFRIGHIGQMGRIGGGDNKLKI
jgi:hypothetical protein